MRASEFILESDYVTRGWMLFAVVGVGLGVASMVATLRKKPARALRLAQIAMGFAVFLMLLGLRAAARLPDLTTVPEIDGEPAIARALGLQDWAMDSFLSVLPGLLGGLALGASLARRAPKP